MSRWYDVNNILKKISFDIYKFTFGKIVWCGFDKIDLMVIYKAGIGNIFFSECILQMKYTLIHRLLNFVLRTCADWWKVLAYLTLSCSITTYTWPIHMLRGIRCCCACNLIVCRFIFRFTHCLVTLNVLYKIFKTLLSLSNYV